MSDNDANDGTTEALATFSAGAAAHQAYIDLLQPAFRELSGPVRDLAKAINFALKPVAGFVWCSEKLGSWLGPLLIRKLEGVRPQDVQTPSATVAGQILLQLPFCADEQHLRDLYATFWLPR